MSSNKIDIHVIGVSGVQTHRVAASATRFYAGEPVNGLVTYTTGVSDINTITQAADQTPIIDAAGANAFFVGIAAQKAEVNNAGTVIASVACVVEPLAGFTRMRGKADTFATVDTLTELIAVLFDYTLWDSASVSGTFLLDTGATPADTSGLRIMGGIWEKGLLDVVVDFRAMRTELTA